MTRASQFASLSEHPSRTRAAIGDALRAAGITVDDAEISTATSATAAHLARHHPDARVLVLDDGPTDDLGDVAIVGEETTLTWWCSAVPDRRAGGSG